MKKWNYVIIGFISLLLGVALIVFRASSKPDVVKTDGNVPMEVARKIAQVTKREVRSEMLSKVAWLDFKSLPYQWRQYWKAQKVFVGSYVENSETIYRVVVWNDPNSYTYVTYRLKQQGNGWKILDRTGQIQ